MKWKYWLLAGLGVPLFLFQFVYFEKRIDHLKYAVNHKMRQYQQLSHVLPAYLASFPLNLPHELDGLPKAERDSIVVAVKTVPLRDAQAPYNGSIVEHGDKFLLFFRYDVVKPLSSVEYKTFVACAELDREFNQTEKEWKTIALNSEFCEDPRVLKRGEDVFLFYNDKVPDYPQSRKMCLAVVSPDDLSTKYISPLNFHMQTQEKNWVPFFKEDKELFFQYKISPLSILKLLDPRKGEIEPIAQGDLQKVGWPKKWGELQGGTPARLIDGQYLAFFHSKFLDRRGMYWYVMGAYTFEASPPYKLTAVSKYPILFEGVYNSPIRNTADLNKRVIYPCGFALGKKEERDIIHLSCGENDSCIKIVTLDKERLMSSLVQVKSSN